MLLYGLENFVFKKNLTGGQKDKMLLTNKQNCFWLSVRRCCSCFLAEFMFLTGSYGMKKYKTDGSGSWRLPY